MTQSRLRDPKTLAPLATLFACAGLVITDGVLSAITPGYDVVGETSSQLMSPDAKYSTIARVSLGLYAVLLVPFAISLREGFGRRRIAAAVAVVAMWIHISMALVSALALNESDAELVGALTANEVHDYAAMAMFASALFVLLPSATSYRHRHSATRLLTFLSLATLVTLGPVFVAELWTEVNGIMERLLAAAFVAWMPVIAWSWRAESSRDLE